jgi:hypothetical protein
MHSLHGRCAAARFAPVAIEVARRSRRDSFSSMRLLGPLLLGAMCQQAASASAVLSVPAATSKDVRLTRAVLEARRYLCLLR